MKEWLLMKMKFKYMIGMSLALILTVWVFTARTAAAETVTIGGVEYERDGWGVKEPESDVQIESAQLTDFGAFFTESYPVEKTSYRLLEGTELEAEVVRIASPNEGPTVYVVSGVHGDERAGWYAASLLKQATVKCGVLYVIAPLNVYGAQNRVRFCCAENIDLNRSFPGSADGNPAERLANAVFSDIDRVNPDFVFDLHEARSTGEKADFLGSSLIYTTLDGIDELFMDLLFATQTGEICSEPFSYNSPGPNGSINSTVGNLLKIPIVTVETFRGYAMSRRIADQLSIVNYVLEYYKMR